MNTKKITSPQNPLVKRFFSLQKAGVRRKHGVFPVEGLREISLAAQAGFDIEMLLYAPQLLGAEKLSDFINVHKIDGVETVELTTSIFNSLVYRKDAENLLALCRIKEMKPEQFKLSQNPLLVILESVEKPGNLGAILRTCDAAGVDAVLVCDPRTDIFNPNVIRASLGTVFTNQVALFTVEETMRWLSSKNISICCATLKGMETYNKADFTKPTAFVMGAEATGLSDKWNDERCKQISIPMFGKVDSMNVSVSAAILIYEAMRQRSFNACSMSSIRASGSSSPM